MGERENHIRDSRRNQKKRQRQQQVKRQLCICALVAAIILIFGTCKIRAHLQEKKELSANKKVTEETKKETKYNEGQQETGEERLERVRKEAQENQYPEKIIELLDKNPETVDFVEHYGENKDKPYASVIEEFQTGVIPKLLQWDERWGCAPYGTSTIAVSGCGPTCVSMVVSYLTDDASVTPNIIAEYAMEQGYVTEDNSSLWLLMEEGPQHWNIQVAECGIDESDIAQTLEQGEPIICNVGKGDFTEGGHFIVLTAYENGKVSVNDPFSKKNTEKPWVYQEIKDQIKGIWSYSLRDN